MTQPDPTTSIMAGDNTTKLAAGVYTLHLHTGSAAVTKRVVME